MSTSTHGNRLLKFTMVLLAMVNGLFLQAQPTPFEPPANPKRYWIIVEKTANAAPFQAAIRQAVFDLVYKGADGEMVNGDVFEIWIYGSETKIRGFTPEMRMPDNHLAIARKASDYVRSFPSVGQGDMPAFAEHVRDMASVVFETTIFLVTAPTTRLNGTSVDDEVNAIFDVHGKRMAELGRPFVTTFRVQDGELAAYSVSESALALALPPMPVSNVSAQERAQMISDARARIDAKETARLEVVAAETKARMEAEEEAKRLARLERAKPDDEREGAIILRGKPKPQNETVPVQVAVAPNEPQVAEVPAKSVSPGNPPDSSAVAPVPNTPQPNAIKDPEPNNITPAAKPTPPSETPAVGESAVEKEETVVPPASGTTVASTDKEPPSAVNEPEKPTGEETDTNTVESVAVANNSPTTSPQTFAVQPQTWFTAGGLFAVGLLFFVVAGFLIWVAVRRTRSASGPSYITQSMQNKRIDRS